MKVLYYNHTGQVSGAERVLLMILSRLDQSTQPVVFCPAQGELSKMVSELGVDVSAVDLLELRFTLKVSRLFQYLRSFCRLIFQLRGKVVAEAPDLIHANSIRAGLVTSLATLGLGKPVVWHLHDELPRHPFSTLIRLLALTLRRSHFLAVSQSVADNFRGAVVPLRSRIATILNAIDLTKFQPKAGEAAKVELHVEDSECVIGIVGQITPRKDQLGVLRAFAEVLREIPTAVLLVVGAPLFNRDDEYAAILTQTANELGVEGNVRMLGARRDVAAIMQALDLLIVNSIVEPFGLVAAEAMACGTPVIATKVGGLVEIIEHGETGWLVPPADEKALVRAILTLAYRPALRLQLAEQGQQSVKTRFSCERYLLELDALYMSLTNSVNRAGSFEPQKQTGKTSLADAS